MDAIFNAAGDDSQADSHIDDGATRTAAKQLAS